MNASLDDKPYDSLSFQHLMRKYVINIVDDGDVKRVKNVILEASDNVYLYLVDIEEMEEGPSPVQSNAANYLNVGGNRSSGKKRGKGSAENRLNGKGGNNATCGFMSLSAPQQPSAFVPYGTQVRVDLEPKVNARLDTASWS